MITFVLCIDTFRKSIELFKSDCELWFYGLLSLKMNSLSLFVTVRYCADENSMMADYCLIYMD